MRVVLRCLPRYAWARCVCSHAAARHAALPHPVCRQCLPLPLLASCCRGTPPGHCTHRCALPPSLTLPALPCCRQAADPALRPAVAGRSLEVPEALVPDLHGAAGEAQPTNQSIHQSTNPVSQSINQSNQSTPVNQSTASMQGCMGGGTMHIPPAARRCSRRIARCPFPCCGLSPRRCPPALHAPRPTPQGPARARAAPPPPPPSPPAARSARPGPT